VTLIDSNVILDIVTDDPIWAWWSLTHLDRASLTGPLIINDVVYAEISVRYQAVEEVDFLLVNMGIQMEPVPRAGLFLAAKAYRRYRIRGGTRTGVLSDFFIGAHAAVQDYPLLTRERSRYPDYFPTLRLIVPN
jgi:predicted nucleic acid-binding protein